MYQDFTPGDFLSVLFCAIPSQKPAGVFPNPYRVPPRPIVSLHSIFPVSLLRPEHGVDVSPLLNLAHAQALNCRLPPHPWTTSSFVFSPPVSTLGLHPIPNDQSVFSSPFPPLLCHQKQFLVDKRLFFSSRANAISLRIGVYASPFGSPFDFSFSPPLVSLKREAFRWRGPFISFFFSVFFSTPLLL